MEILTIDEVAEMLKVKTSWIYARTRDGALAGTGRGRKPSKHLRARPNRSVIVERIPCNKKGRLLRFEREKVLAWWHEGDRFDPKPSVACTETASQAIKNTSASNA